MGTGVAVLIPVGVLGAVLWLVLLLTRRSAPFTLATALSLYAHWMTIAGLTLSLAGVAVGVKLLLSGISEGFSYFVPQVGCPPDVAAAGKCTGLVQPNTGDLIRNDVVLAVSLLAVGLVVLGLHIVLAREVRRRPGGAPAIITTGTLVALTVLYGIAGVVSGVAALYGVLNYALPSALPVTQPQPFGDAVGAAVAFIPAWVIAALRLLRATRPVAGGPEPEAAAAAA